MSDQRTDPILELTRTPDKLCTGIEVMSGKQNEMSKDIVKIKEAVYNPDTGLYARLRELESWKSTSTKMIWILFTSMIGLIGAFVLKNIGN